MNYRIAAQVGVLLAGAGLIYFNRNRLANLGWAFVPPNRELYVADLGANSIFGFAIDANGRVASTPGRIIRGPSTGLVSPISVALDNSDRIWVVNLGHFPGRPDSNPSITVYEANANGNAVPMRTIPQWTEGPFGFREPVNPTAIAVRREPENPLVADSEGNCIYELSMSRQQNMPTGQLSGPQTQLGTPMGVALDLQGRVYVAKLSLTAGTGSAVLVYVVQAHQFIDPSPTAVISGPATLLNHPNHIALDGQNQLYVINRGSPNQNRTNGTVTVYAAGATGDVAPIRSIGVRFAGLSDPYGIAVDSVGRVFVSGAWGTLVVYAAGANGNATPEQTINYRNLSVPMGLAVR